jgi:hypothetical protein
MFLCQAGQWLAVTSQQLAAIGRTLAEGIDALVIPARQDVLRTVGHRQNMDVDVVLLTDPVEPADPLFQQIRIQWQIPQDQPMGKLEVAPLGADF